VSADENRPQEAKPHSTVWDVGMVGFPAYATLRTELPRSELAWLFSMGKTRSLMRGEVFCDIGQTRHEIGFLEQGILVVYTLAPDGTRMVLDFLFAGHFALPLDAALKRKPSEECFEAVTQCRLSVWPYEVRDLAFARHRGWLQLDNTAAQTAFVRKNRRFLALTTKSARQRYEEMDRDLPPQWRDIPLHLIASYLNITPQYLSRLRRQDACK
jgi:CRP-like cAMP-binding protein